MKKNKFFVIVPVLAFAFFMLATAFTTYKQQVPPKKSLLQMPYTDSTARQRADSLYRLADTLRQNDRLEDALRHLNWAIKLYEKAPLYYLDRGAIYVQINLPEKAIVDLLKARTLDTTDAALAMKVYANLAVAENNLEHWDASIAYSTKTLTYNPQWGFPYFIRSESYQHKGDTIKMCNDLTAALRYGVSEARDRIIRYCAKEVQFKP
jgi:tetratricopeptide (TPR) repeat protein